jgi:hypothetical protein
VAFVVSRGYRRRILNQHQLVVDGQAGQEVGFEDRAVVGGDDPGNHRGW